MTYKFHGVFSIILVGFTLLIGLFAAARLNLVMGLIYAVLIVSLLAVIIYFYCGKCICREYHCGHIIPGKIAKLLPARKLGKYSAFDMTCVSTALLILAAFPQYWLLKSIPMFIAFWGLLLAATIDIVAFVCPACKNTNCALCRKK